MPSSAFDTFFACTVIVSAVMIATAFLGVTLQARITDTGDANKDSYLKALADHLVAYPGSPSDWGTETASPSDFGLAAYPSAGSYQLDINKIGRLSRQNTNMLSYVDLLTSAKLNNMALGIAVRQIMDLNLTESSRYTADGETFIQLTVATSINSKPTPAVLNCYVVADNYLYNASALIAESGSYSLTIHVPTGLADEAYAMAFARAAFDERMTSFAIYNIADAVQETSPASTDLSLSPQNYRLSFNEPLGVSVENVYAFTYSYASNITALGDSNCAIPRIVDSSPIVLVACGQNGPQYLQEWTSYPQIPLDAGSTFTNSERNVFSYIVTVEGVLYRVEVSLGDIYR